MGLTLSTVCFLPIIANSCFHMQYRFEVNFAFVHLNTCWTQAIPKGILCETNTKPANALHNKTIPIQTQAADAASNSPLHQHSNIGHWIRTAIVCGNLGTINMETWKPVRVGLLHCEWKTFCSTWAGYVWAAYPLVVFINAHRHYLWSIPWPNSSRIKGIS